MNPPVVPNRNGHAGHECRSPNPPNPPERRATPTGRSPTPPGSSSTPPGSSSTPPGSSSTSPGSSSTSPGSSSTSPGSSSTPTGRYSMPTTAAAAQKCARIPLLPSMPQTIDEDDTMLDYAPETWIASMIGRSGLLYRFSESLVYKSNVSPREADLMEAAGNLTLRPVTRVIWRGTRPTTGTKAVIMEFGKRFRPGDIAPTRLQAVIIEMFLLVQNLHGKRGIVHGDIKLSNFLWGQDGRLKLADFSSARFIEENPDLWNSSYVTEPYLTPDRMRQRQESAVRGVYGRGRTPAPTVFDDYYALGITLWSIFTCKKPVNHQFNQKNIRRSDLAEVDDDLVRRWISKVFKMAGCRFF